MRVVVLLCGLCHVVAMKARFFLACGISAGVCALTPLTPSGHPIVPLPGQGDMTLLPHYPAGYPLPSYENLIQEPTFLVSMSSRLRMPNWIAEKMEGSNIGLPVTLASLIPQDAQLRRGDWLRLEQFAFDLVKDQPDRIVFSLTGPLWLPYYDEVNRKRMVKYPVIGDKDIPVPTHLFKILKLTYKGEDIGTAGFILPNLPLDTQRSISEYQVDLGQIEKAAGLNLNGMRCRFNLCEAVSAEEPSDSRLVWKVTWKIKIAHSIDEIRSIVSEAIKQDIFTRSNFDLISTTHKRLVELTGDEDTGDMASVLFDESNQPSYGLTRDAFDSLHENKIVHVIEETSSIIGNFCDILGVGKSNTLDRVDQQVVDDLKDILNCKYEPLPDSHPEVLPDASAEPLDDQSIASDGKKTIQVDITTNPQLLGRLRAIGAIRHDESPERVLLGVKPADLDQLLELLDVRLPRSDVTVDF